MRFAALVVAALSLGACGARGAGEPAWPKTADRETDGGESIAPRESVAVAAAEEATEETTEVTAAAAAAATPGAAAAATTPTTTSTPTVTAPEDTIMIEEIVIEISDE